MPCCTVFNAVGSILAAGHNADAEPGDVVAAARRVVLALTQDGGTRP